MLLLLFPSVGRVDSSAMMASDGELRISYPCSLAWEIPSDIWLMVSSSGCTLREDLRLVVWPSLWRRSGVGEGVSVNSFAEYWRISDCMTLSSVGDDSFDESKIVRRFASDGRRCNMEARPGNVDSIRGWLAAWNDEVEAVTLIKRSSCSTCWRIASPVGPISTAFDNDGPSFSDLLVALRRLLLLIPLDINVAHAHERRTVHQ